MTLTKIPGDMSAIAFKIAAVLESYQLDIERLLSHWLDRNLYRKATAHLDELGKLLGALPQLAVDMVEVVVCHVKLLHLLEAHGPVGAAVQVQTRQSDAVRTLRRKTLKILAGPDAGR